jgi:hypothetical protein
MVHVRMFRRDFKPVNSIVQYFWNLFPLSVLNLTTILSPYVAAVRAKSTFPAFTSAPPIHVLVNGLFPHVALAALTQPSHLPLVISMVCPAVAALSVNFAVPDSPVVVVGSPPHCSMVPAIPPQMESRATLMSWSTSVLCDVSREDGMGRNSRTLMGQYRLYSLPLPGLRFRLQECERGGPERQWWWLRKVQRRWLLSASWIYFFSRGKMIV